MADKPKLIAIVGPTGHGKSTLVQLLTRFYDVDSGAVLLDGHDIREISDDVADLRRIAPVQIVDEAIARIRERELPEKVGVREIVAQAERAMRRMDRHSVSKPSFFKHPRTFTRRARIR